MALELRSPPQADLPPLPRPPSEHAVLTTPADRNRCLSVSSLPARPSPHLSGVGIHNFTFEACSSFTRVTACPVAHRPKAGFVTRLRSGRWPSPIACQLPRLTDNYMGGSSLH